MSEKKKISVMIPCYNEEENARPIYEAVKNEYLTSKGKATAKYHQDKHMSFVKYNLS